MADTYTEEQERALALARARKKRDEQPGGMTQFSSGFIQGTAKTLGAPVDIINSVLSAFGGGHPEPLGGSKNIQRGMAAIGLTGPIEEPIELGQAGKVGDVVGQTVAAGPALVGAGVRSATVAARPLAKTPGMLRRVAQDVAETAVRSPKTFVAGETAAATTAGLAGFEAAQQFPDSPGAQAMAEIAGGFAPLAATAALRTGARAVASATEHLPLLGPIVVRTARKLVSGLTPKGGRSRARARVRRAVEDPELAAARLKRTDVLPEAPLTPAQRAGDEGLLALEAAVMDATPELSVARRRQFSDVNRTIRESLNAPVREVPTHQVKEYFQGLLDTRLQIAAARADERLAELGAKATREDLNRIAREELLRARSAARAQESQLHEAIPANARVPTQSGQEAVQEIVLSLPAAQRGDVPTIAVKLLHPQSKAFLGDETNIKELRGLQGKLREQARIARSNGELNSARLADDIADALTDDISNAIGGAEVREAVDRAVSFSRDLNDRFTRGSVGKLLGTERTGGVAVPEGLTLEVTVGQRGPRAREDTDALLEAVRRSGDEPAMREHIQDFLMDDFRRAAVRDGRVDIKAAERYLQDNQDVLARFPETRRTMEHARTAGGELAEAERLADPRVSRAAVFINASPGREIEHVISTSKPREAMDELVAMARKDPSGKAEQGLKAAFMDFLLKRSELTSQLDVDDLPFVSGARMARELEDPQVLQAMVSLYSKEELRRIAQIRQTALQLDRARAATATDEGVIGDMPGRVTSLLARVLSAQAGRVIAGKTGGGTVQTPGIMASNAQQLVKAGIQDPAKRLLNDAMQDESLFRALLIAPDTAVKQRAVKARLNAWVIDVLREQHEFDDQEDK